ncbi:MAG: hypothetical protein KGJ60_00490 [Verrucomicrobiota bacterium]|nr:hypothetical protein [Verrucomicrobiota bacterium]
MPAANTSDNPVTITLNTDDKAAILADIAALSGKLNFLVGLTNEQRRKMLKLGDKSIGFDEKCASYMAARPELIPGFVDTTTLAAARADLADIQRALGELAQRADDTDMVLAHEVFLPELSFYHSVQQAAKHGVPGAQAIYDDLRTRFPGRPTASTKPAPTKAA